jgi:hypothetical protein
MAKMARQASIRRILSDVVPYHYMYGWFGWFI